MNEQGPEGLLFAGKYKITKMIGKGGMANVYLAIDMSTGTNVAVKILKPEYSNNDEFIKRFDTEARAVSSLNHANIVKVYGVGHEHNYRYIIQEYVQGITVKELINQNGHLDWRVAVPIAIQVGMAVEHAHRNGFGVVREYCGHGVGLHVHEEPEIPNYVSRFSPNPRIREGMVIAIEPMINLGGDGIIDMPDGWTVVTADGKPAAHWEHTVAITANGPEILTQL